MHLPPCLMLKTVDNHELKRLSNDFKLFQAVKAGLAGIEELGGNWENLKSGMRFYNMALFCLCSRIWSVLNLRPLLSGGNRGLYLYCGGGECRSVHAYKPNLGCFIYNLFLFQDSASTSQRTATGWR